MQKFSYHTHTSFSDGVNSVDEMLARASSLGWSEIGVSDHMMVHKNIKKVSFYEFLKFHKQEKMAYDNFSEALPAFNRHAEEVRKVAKKYPELKVRVGYEVDFFTYNGWLDEFKDFCRNLDYDYLLTGNHFFLSEDGECLLNISCYDSVPDNEKNESLDNYIHRHLQTLKQAVNSKMFNFLAHIDYVRQVRGYNKDLYSDDYTQLIEALAKNNVATELSTKGLRKSGDYFPCSDLLHKVCAKNIPLVISDDAHCCSEVGYLFEKAENTLEGLNYSNRFHLK